MPLFHVFVWQLETLLKFFPMPVYRNLTLQCLTEVFVLPLSPSNFLLMFFGAKNIAGCCMFCFLQVAALSFGDFYNMQYVKMYTIFMVQLQVV